MIMEFMEQGLKAEEVEVIQIETYQAAAKLNGQEAINSFAMRFSIPVSIAVCMIFENLTIENVTDEHVRDERVLQLAKKINVKENQKFTSKLPNRRAEIIDFCRQLETKEDFAEVFRLLVK